MSRPNLDEVAKNGNIESMDNNQKRRYELTAEIFKAMGHPMRLAILEKLKDRSWCVCELADDLKLNKSVTSKHLSQLRSAGILETEKHGTQVVYTLATPCVLEMSECSLRATIEQRNKRMSFEGVQ